MSGGRRQVVIMAAGPARHSKEIVRQRARADAAVTELQVEHGGRVDAEPELRRALKDARGHHPPERPAAD